MNVAAPQQNHDRWVAQQAAARRLGVAIVFTSLVVTTLAFVVYVRDGTLHPVYVSRESAGFAPAGGAASDADQQQVLSVLDDFVAALQRDDDAAMHAVYPTMSGRDARILRQIRHRLGASAGLSVAGLRTHRQATGDVSEDFVIVATRADGRQLRMPFVAVLHRQASDWKIVELH